MPDDEIMEDGLNEYQFEAVQGEAPAEGAGWRLAKSLKVLLAEVNDLAPNRNKRHDGTIGDAAHAARASRHNPNNSGVVCALDTTHDPTGGFDAHKIAREHVKHAHPCLAYVISNRQVARRSNGWQWVAYRGASPHAEHVHWAVGVGPDSEPRPPYDDTVPWGIFSAPSPSHPLIKLGSSGEAVKDAQKLLASYGYQFKDLGNFDGHTFNVTWSFQVSKLLEFVDGIIGPETWGALEAHKADRRLVDNGRPYMEGPDVVWVQRVLQKYGFSLDDDGEYGSISERAVVKLQRREGLVTDGIVGPRTWFVLRRVSNPPPA